MKVFVDNEGRTGTIYDTNDPRDLRLLEEQQAISFGVILLVLAFGALCYGFLEERAAPWVRGLAILAGIGAIILFGGYVSGSI